jgi:hypothetical protein
MNPRLGCVLTRMEAIAGNRYFLLALCQKKISFPVNCPGSESKGSAARSKV